MEKCFVTKFLSDDYDIACFLLWISIHWVNLFKEVKQR